MRAVPAVALVFVAGLSVVLTTTTASKTTHNYPRLFKHRTRLREIRGFKPEYISTAIGFGKRQSPGADDQDLNGRERILLSFLRNFPRDVSTEVLRAMQTNPALASKLMQLLSVPMSDQDDEESMMNDAKPEGALF